MRPLFNSFLFFTLIALSSSGCVHAQPGQIDVGPPASARFESSLAAMTAEFDARCQTYDVRELDLASLPIAETSHVQVDCHGFSHAGGERLAEFVFADDSLVFMWVLTSAEEEAALLKALLASYGAPTHDTPLFVAFADDFLALRRDIPELLYYSETVAPLYRGWFDQSAGAQ